MNFTTLKLRLERDLPIYFSASKVSVVDIYEVFGLVDIREFDDDIVFIVDVETLSDVPYVEKSICFNTILCSGEVGYNVGIR